MYIIMGKVWRKRMVFKRWNVNKVDKQLVKNIASECDIDQFLALLAVCRNITDPYDIDEMLSDDINISDPFDMVDMDKAVCTVNGAIENDKLIAVFGDYDCDGINATAILYDYLLSRGARVIAYIPDRINEGYGISTQAVDKLYNQGVNLIITVDNGINAVQEVKRANDYKMDVVITDHHLPSGELPDAAAVVDCHRSDCGSEFKDLCGAAVAFKLCCALGDMSPEEMLDRYAESVAVATVGDIMPLIGENRAFVKAGINKLQQGGHTGFSALIEASGLKDKPIASGSISFGIVPRINAVGRVDNPKKAFDLLVEKDPNKAIEMAKEINEFNVLRQTTEQEITKNAIEIINKNGYEHDRVIVVSGEGWHQGVIGIVAARLVDKYGKPAVVLSVNGDTAVGSARCIEGISIFECLQGISDVLIKFGGHKSAAGLTVDSENIPILRSRLNDWVSKLKVDVPTVDIDCILNPSALSVEMAHIIKLLEPFGYKNKMPVFGLTGLRLDRITPIGNKKHLRLVLSKDTAVLTALLFGTTPDNFCFDVGDTVDIAVEMSANVYNGTEQLNLSIKHIRMHGIDDQQFSSQLELYDCLKRTETVDYSDIAPTRDDVAAVFRMYDSKGKDEYCINHLLPKLPLGKILSCRDILLEIGVLAYDDNNNIVRVAGAKSDLQNSKYYKMMTGGNC